MFPAFKIKGYGRDANYRNGRFAVTALLYEYVGVLELPHKTMGKIVVPEKALRGEQTYVVPLLEAKVSRKQARERALSNLLKRKGFSRLARLYIFGAYMGKIHSDRVRATMLRLGVQREDAKVLVQRG